MTKWPNFGLSNSFKRLVFVRPKLQINSRINKEQSHWKESVTPNIGDGQEDE